MTALPAKNDLRGTIKALIERKEALKQIENVSFKTNGEFRWNPQYTANAPIQIQKTTDLGLLISIYSYIKKASDAYENAAEELNLSNYPAFTWLNFTWDAWKHDLKLRVALIQKETTSRELTKQINQLEGFLSEDDLLAQALESAKRFL